MLFVTTEIGVTIDPEFGVANEAQGNATWELSPSTRMFPCKFQSYCQVSISPEIVQRRASDAINTLFSNRFPVIDRVPTGDGRY